VAAIEFQNVELHDPVDGGDQNLTPAQGQRFVRPPEKYGSPTVLKTMSAPLPPVNSRTRVATSAFDASITSTSELAVAFVRFAFAHHADHTRAVPGGDLHRGLPDLAVDTHHQPVSPCLAYRRGESLPSP